MPLDVRVKMHMYHTSLDEAVTQWFTRRWVHLPQWYIRYACLLLDVYVRSGGRWMSVHVRRYGGNVYILLYMYTYSVLYGGHANTYHRCDACFCFF